MPTVKRLEGREHFVVTMIMLRVGTFNGSNGPVFYPADELRESVSAWNSRAVVVYHPQLNGRGVSAGDPDITNQYKVGVIFNTRFDGTNLKADAWIDKERVSRVDNRVYQAILNHRRMEVSTGLVMDFDTLNTNGQAPIARNYRPDHLAILPDQVGACSLVNGCGLQLNQAHMPLLDEEPLLVPTSV